MAAYLAIIQMAASYYAAKAPKPPVPVEPGVCAYCDSPRPNRLKRCEGCGATKVKET